MLEWVHHILLALAALSSRTPAPPAIAGSWTFGGGESWTSTGTMLGSTCCTRTFEATRVLALPLGGTVDVAVRSPCGQAVVILLDGGADRRWSQGPRTDATFDGVVSLAVPPGGGTLTIFVEGGLHCCGPVEVRAVDVRVAAP